MLHVTMVLARGPGFSDGNLADRMHLHVLLTPQGQLDPAAWETGTTPWMTSRERPDHATRSGELVKIDGGWALRELGGEDGPLYSVTAQLMRPGEIVQVSRLDGEDMLYRIVAVEAE